jgi:LysM repeat protein
MNRAGYHLKGLFLLLLFFLAAPASGKADFLHVVERGESLHSIAKKYHLTVKAIQEANGLQETKIRVGQRLAIPGEETKSGVKSQRKKGAEPGGEELPDWDIPETHTVKKGETLAKIGHLYHLSVEDMKAINDLKGKNLKSGQIIYLLPPLEAGNEEAERGENKGQKEKGEGRREVAQGNFKESEYEVDERDREVLARVAKAFLGLKYTRGGTSINGMDCSAFVQKVFRVINVDLPRTTREQFQIGYAVAREALRMGDLVFFRRGEARRPGHVGIYIGDGQFIHTSLRKKQVEVNQLENRYFARRFLGAKRIGEAAKQPEIEELGGK